MTDAESVAARYDSFSKEEKAEVIKRLVGAHGPTHLQLTLAMDQVEQTRLALAEASKKTKKVRAATPLAEGMTEAQAARFNEEAEKHLADTGAAKVRTKTPQAKGMTQVDVNAFWKAGNEAYRRHARSKPKRNKTTGEYEKTTTHAVPPQLAPFQHGHHRNEHGRFTAASGAVEIRSSKADKMVQKFKTDGPVTINMFDFNKANGWVIGAPSFLYHRKYDWPAAAFADQKLHPLWMQLQSAGDERLQMVLDYLKRHFPHPVPRSYVPGVQAAFRSSHPETSADIEQRLSVVFGPQEASVEGKTVSVVVCKADEPRLSFAQFFHEGIGIPFKMTLPSPYAMLGDLNCMFIDVAAATMTSTGGRLLSCVCNTAYGPVFYTFCFDVTQRLSAVVSLGHEVGKAVVVEGEEPESSSEDDDDEVTIEDVPADASKLPPPLAAISAKVDNARLREFRSTGAPVDIPNFANDSDSFSLTTDPQVHFEQVAAGDNAISRFFKRFVYNRTIGELTSGDPQALMTTLEGFKAQQELATRWVDALSVVKDDNFPGDLQNDSSYEHSQVNIDEFTLAGKTSFFSYSESDVDAIIFKRTTGGQPLNILYGSLKKDMPIDKFFDNGFTPGRASFRIEEKNIHASPLNKLTQENIDFKITIKAFPTNITWLIGEARADKADHMHLFMLRLYPGRDFAPPFINAFALLTHTNI